MELTRREWIAGIAGAGMAAGQSGYAPGLAVQVYVWTQYLRKKEIALVDGVEDVIAGSTAAGFENAELMSSFFAPEVRERTLELLRKYELAVPVVYHGGPMHTQALAEKTIAQTLELAPIAKQAGAKIINTNPVPKPKRAPKTSRELAVQAKAVQRLGDELTQQGIDLILHHHDPEMANNAREWQHLFDNTDLGLCIDTMWVKRGGQEPMEIVRKAGNRLRTLHLRNLEGGVCTEAFGDGDIDYRVLADYLRGIGFQGWLIVELFHEPETEVTRTLEENLRLSRRYAEEVFGL
ncbi:MAG: TIM barrel protein [bacterium]|nr:TIM barrel protein [bacterium]